MLGGANGDLAPWFLGDYQLLMAKGFQAAYAPWRLLIDVPQSSRPWVEDEIDAGSGRLPLTLYVRRDSPAWAAVRPLRCPCQRRGTRADFWSSARRRATPYWKTRELRRKPQAQTELFDA